jgi:hypothetical protein
MSKVAEVHEWRGRTVVDRDGEKIRKLDEIYLDRDTNEPEWALVKTGLLGTRSSFVPLKGAAPADDDVRVAHAKGQVKDARPSIPTANSPSRRRSSSIGITGCGTRR